MSVSIRFVPSLEDFDEEWGEFLLNVTHCLDYLRKQVALYALSHDALLLKWMDGAQGRSVIPDKFDERARFMVAELLHNELVLDVFCRKCEKSFPRGFLATQQWDDSFDVSGIRVGAAGYQINCPSGHCLLSICEQIY